MYAIKTIYENLPDKITVPPELIHRRAEVIIILNEEMSARGKTLSDFQGTLPDFPERFPQGDFEKREPV